MSAPTARYDRIGGGYSVARRTDPRIGQPIHDTLAGAVSVANVGAGTGSYEPDDIPTIAIEPSARMIRQRRDTRNAVQANAEAIPLRDDAVDCTMAILTVHHWSSLAQGLAECARIARRKVIIFTWDPEAPGFWLTRDYFPEILALDRDIFPSVQAIRRCLGPVQVRPVPIPADCRDGFLGAYWRRPRAYLDREVRAGISSFSLIDDLPARLEQLESDLADGTWRRVQGEMLPRDNLDLGYRLVTAVVN
ncbi:MAG: SAM-dependent methyltransferase [Halioglobus sp.]|nr:SAM-dependent methyltransferase [Halioglobus sp.]